MLGPGFFHRLRLKAFEVVTIWKYNQALMGQGILIYCEEVSEYVLEQQTAMLYCGTGHC